jgi:hypothetical protein
MGDKPIIFSAPMVRALIEGRKSQTRRVLPKAHPRFPQHNQVRMDVLTYDPMRPEAWYWDGVHDRVGASYTIPYAPGDRLYVREAWRTERGLDRQNATEIEAACLGAGYSRVWAPISYEVDEERVNFENGMVAGRYRHARFMPRWASRITLTVTEVRVQRLQDISEADAVAEGVYLSEPTEEDHEWKREFDEENGYDSGPMTGVWMAPGVRQGWGRDKAERDRDQWGPTPQFCFRLIWNSLHGPDAWDANLWVVALTFTVALRNIDDTEAL